MENYNCEWTLDSLLFVTTPPSFHYGFSEEYSPLSDGALELPLIKLAPNSEMTFSHIYDIEAGYDGGIVEIRDGQNWSLLTPDNGYPGYSVSNGSYPGGQCFNGEMPDWTQENFQLDSYEGCVKIRFRFGSDGGVEGEGWNIDEFTVNSEQSGISAEPASPIPAQFTLEGNYPNPFNNSTMIRFTIPRGGMVKLTVFNLLGQRVHSAAYSFSQAGEYKIAWENHNLPTGIYMYQLEFAGKRLLEKCLLLK